MGMAVTNKRIFTKRRPRALNGLAAFLYPLHMGVRGFVRHQVQDDVKLQQRFEAAEYHSVSSHGINSSLYYFIRTACKSGVGNGNEGLMIAPWRECPLGFGLV